MSAAPERARSNQKLRTRKALLEAAGRLMRQGSRPTLEEVAQEALVSRATAYRYFPSLEALLVEAGVHVVVPRADELFADAPDGDPLQRLLRVEAALHEATVTNEPALRLMLASTVEQAASAAPSELPVRQNRRSPLIDAALAPAARTLRGEPRALLGQAVALIVGVEALVAAKDVLGLDAAAAHRLKRWMIAALLAAALAGQPAPE
jgi:AcrR family transcriptional regulator